MSTMPAPLSLSAFFGDAQPSESSSVKESERRWKRILSDLRSRPQQKGLLVLRAFRKQDQAIEFQRAHRNHRPPLRIFSFEDNPDEPGKRKFLVATVRDFWFRYVRMDVRHRHYYEMIQENRPCHLYFDIEFGRNGVNLNVDGDKVVRALTLVACRAYAWACGIDWKGSINPAVVVDLQSLNAIKFSRHVVVRMSGHAFRSNAHTGRFVAAMVLALRDELMMPIQLSKQQDILEDALLSHKHRDLRRAIREIVRDLDAATREALVQAHVTHAEDAPASSSELSVTDSVADVIRPRQLCVDTGVYSRNRNFRLWLSSKIGKQAVLEVVASECMVPITMDEKGFRLTMVTDVPVVEDEQRHEQIHGNKHVPLRLIEVDDVFTVSIFKCDRHSHDLEQEQPSTTTTKTTAMALKPAQTSVGTRITKYSDIDDYIVHFIESTHPGRSKAFVRSSVFFQDSHSLVCTIGGNRFCYNVGREHKSNGVYYVVNLPDGYFTQRCYDPDCRHFRSTEFPIPIDINPYLSCLMDEDNE